MAYKQAAQLPFNSLDNRLYEIDSFPRQAIPTTVGLLMKRTVKRAYIAPYETDGADMVTRAIMTIYLSAYQPSPTVQAIDRVYRLLDGSVNGTDYALGTDGKPLALPLLPPNIPIEMDVRGLLLNIYNTLAADGGGELDDDMLAELIKIVGLLA